VEWHDWWFRWEDVCCLQLAHPNFPVTWSSWHGWVACTFLVGLNWEICTRLGNAWSLHHWVEISHLQSLSTEGRERILWKYFRDINLFQHLWQMKVYLTLKTFGIANSIINSKKNMFYSFAVGNKTAVSPCYHVGLTCCQILMMICYNDWWKVTIAVSWLQTLQHTKTTVSCGTFTFCCFLLLFGEAFSWFESEWNSHSGVVLVVCWAPLGSFNIFSLFTSLWHGAVAVIFTLIPLTSLDNSCWYC